MIATRTIEKAGTSKKPMTRSLLLVGVGLLAAVNAGCGNGVVSAAPADGSSGLSRGPSVVSPTDRPSGTASSATASAPHSPTSSASRSVELQKDSSSSPSPAALSHRPSPSGTSETSSSTKPSSGTKTSSTSATRSTKHLTCTLGDLRFSVRQADGGGAAGSQYVLLDFANTSSTDCWLYGYPGVSFVGYANGTQLGAAAERTTGTTVRSVELNPGHSTTALLQIANAGNYDATSCAPTSADGLRIYPPASHVSAYVPFRIQACQRSTSKQLTVSPVGTSG